MEKQRWEGKTQKNENEIQEKSCDTQSVFYLFYKLQNRLTKTPGQKLLSWSGSLSCSKGSRRCSGQHISKSKLAKHTTFGPVLAVEMFKKCTTLRNVVARNVCRNQTAADTHTHMILRTRFEVGMFKKGTQFRREAPCAVKMQKK